jgi:hypothetical protein
VLSLRQLRDRLLSPPKPEPGPRPRYSERPATRRAFRFAGLDCTRERGELELAPVRTRSHARDALEQAAEGCGVFVPDRVADRVDGLGCPLEPAFRLLDAGPGRLAVVFREAGFRSIRRAYETPFNIVLAVRR